MEKNFINEIFGKPSSTEGRGRESDTRSEVMELAQMPAQPLAGSIESVAEGVAKLNVRSKKLSGAARRKRARAAREARVEGSSKEQTPSQRTEASLQAAASTSTLAGGAGACSSGKTPSGRGAKKRNRSDADSPGTQAPTKKRAKAGSHLSYRDQVIGTSMAVIPAEFPRVRMTVEQIDALRESLTLAIGSVVPNEVAPQFWGSRATGGLLKLTCATAETRKWLEKTVPTLSPWEGANLKTIEEKDLPKLYRVAIWFPKDVREPHEILGRLELQNAPIQASTWRTMGRKVDDNGQTLALSIDEESLRLIKDRQMRLFFNLTTVLVRRIGGEGKEGDTSGPNGTGPTDEGGPSKPTT